MSHDTVQLIAAIREWADDPTAVCYFLNRSSKPSIAITPEEVQEHPDDPELLNFLCTRLREADQP